MFFCHFSKDFRKLRSSDVLAILLIAYGHILPKLFEFFKLNIEIAQNIFCHFSIVVENMRFKRKSIKNWHPHSIFVNFSGRHRSFFFSFLCFVGRHATHTHSYADPGNV